LLNLIFFFFRLIKMTDPNQTFTRVFPNSTANAQEAPESKANNGAYQTYVASLNMTGLLPSSTLLFSLGAAFPVGAIVKDVYATSGGSGTGTTDTVEFGLALTSGGSIVTTLYPALPLGAQASSPQTGFVNGGQSAAASAGTIVLATASFPVVEIVTLLVTAAARAGGLQIVATIFVPQNIV
jgi:hypothetical protein